MRRAYRVAGVLGAGFVAWLFAIWPPPLWYRTHWPRQTAFMAMRTADTVVRYRPVPLDSIAPVMAEVAMIGEDANFLHHGGIDYLALAHALGYRRMTFSWADARDRRDLLAVLPHAWSRRDKLRGASTITQQLAKNLYLSPSRNPLRKLKEALITWRLEAALDKRRIMELYLNVAELGRGVWGVEAASRLYFKRGARELTVEQAAALAGALPFPRSSNPALRPGRMRWRQDLILRRLRGEEVEVPQVEPETEQEPTDSLPATPPLDTLLAPDSLAPAEAPADSAGVEVPADTTATAPDTAPVVGP